MPKTWQSLLTSKGYSVRKLEKKYRTHGGIIRSDTDNKDYFFKSSSLPEINKKIENEAKWYAEINPISDQLSVYIPRLIDEGSFNGFSWLIREYFPENLIAADEDKRSVAGWFNRDLLIKSVDFIKQIPALSFSPVVSPEFEPSQDLLSTYLTSTDQEKVINALEMLRRSHSSEFSKYIQSAIGMAKEARLQIAPLSYVDYKLWHFFQSGSGLTLIDAEHISTKSPLHFDISFYFSHLFVTMDRPDLARIAFFHYAEGLSSSEKEIFITHFRPIISRLGLVLLFDAVKDKRATEPSLGLLKLASLHNLDDYIMNLPAASRRGIPPEREGSFRDIHPRGETTGYSVSKINNG